jgi:hypothetical protein
MKREEILYQVLQELANEGNEKAKLGLRLCERDDSPTPSKIIAELTSAMAAINKAAGHIDSGYDASAVAELDKVRMNILAATAALSHV